MTTLSPNTWLLTALAALAAAPAFAQPQPPAKDDAAADANTVALATLTPQRVEVGTIGGEASSPTDQPGVIEFGSWADTMGFWPNHTKSIANVADDFKLPEGQPYRSVNPAAFVVAGHPVAGVGLLVRTPGMYHELEYQVPQDAAAFTARLFFTDDPFGHARGYRKSNNQNGTVIVTVDGREVFRKDFLRQNIEDGSGEKFADLEFRLPADAQLVCFRVQHSPWGDGNNNTELVLFRPRFHLKK